jgi:hypothetical protein
MRCSRRPDWTDPCERRLGGAGSGRLSLSEPEFAAPCLIKDKAASPAQATATTAREAYEEVGVVLHEIEHAGRVWTAPGISSEMIDLYLAPYSPAVRIHVGGGLPTEQEQIDVVELGLDELWSMAQRNEIEDLKTLTLVLLLKVRRPELFGP